MIQGLLAANLLLQLVIKLVALDFGHAMRSLLEVFSLGSQSGIELMSVLACVSK